MANKTPTQPTAHEVGAALSQRKEAYKLELRARSMFDLSCQFFFLYCWVLLSYAFVDA